MTDRTALRALVEAGYMPLSEYIAYYGDVDADAAAASCQRHTQEAVRRSSFTQHTPMGAGSPRTTAGAHPSDFSIGMREGDIE